MELKWNVYIGNFNKREIETYNIFEHWKFKEDCDKAWKKYKTDFHAFSKEVKSSLMYYFWGKCEWEVTIHHWPPNENFRDKKIDVFEQVMLNWDVFIVYVWNTYYLNSSRKKDIKLQITSKNTHVSSIELEEEYEEL